MMKKTCKRIILVLLTIVMVFTALPTVCFADGEDSAGETIQISVPFCSIPHKQFEWNFPYSDGFFTVPSTDFSLELARASMGLTVSAFRYDNEPLDVQYETYLGAAGFTNITPFGYDRTPALDSIAGVVACKKIGDFTLIAAAACGYGYGSEWGGNMYVGNGERHAGFDNAAKILEEKIDQFIEINKLQGKLKLWVTGFSRAAAVGNLTAADMIKSGRFEDVFAYLFGVPRTTRNPEFLDGIFNICGKFDPVTTVPLQSWGFDRYGRDGFTPAEEMDAKYQSLLLKASNVSIDMTDTLLSNNPEVNYQLHMIIEFLGEMFPTAEEYTEEFQDILVKAMSDVTFDNILETLLSALSQLKKLDRRQSYSSDVLEDYLSYIISQHTAKDQEQVMKGWWDPALSLGENVIREHLPITYIAWLFSDIEETQLLWGPAYTRMIVVDADADVEVLREGEVIGGADRDGHVIDIWEQIDWQKYESLAEAFEDLHSICAIRNGTKTVLNIPMNDRYTIKIRTYKPTNVVYYDIVRTSHVTYGSSDKMHVFVAGEGEYSFDSYDAEPLSELNVISGRASNVQEVDYTYSTTVMMADEAGRSSHISLKTLLQIIFCAVVFTLILLIICAVLWGIHRLGNKKTGKTYSALYTIVPHLLLIVMFALLTLFFTVNLFAIGAARSVFAGITVFIMFLLALRGTLKNRKPYNIVITTALLLISFVNAFIYQKSELVSASVIHTVVYCIAMLMLTLLALSTFRSGSSAGSKASEDIV